MGVVRGNRKLIHTPEGHEDSEEDGGRVVEQVGCAGGATGSGQVPVVTHSVTQRTHREVLLLITHLQATHTVTFFFRNKKRYILYEGTPLQFPCASNRGPNPDLECSRDTRGLIYNR